MTRKRLSHRTTRAPGRLAGWWIDARFFWHRLDKTPLVVVGLLGALALSFGLLLNSISIDRTHRESLTCLARNIYYEARGEPEDGQYAVAEVTMNRVASRHYPDTVCSVVYQKNWDSLRRRYVGAFSWTELQTLPMPTGEEWRSAWAIAEAVYYGRRPPALAGVLHYHADYVKPSWSRGRTPVAAIGSHRFYR